MQFEPEQEIQQDGSKIYFDIFRNSKREPRSLSTPHVHSFFEYLLIDKEELVVVFGEEQKLCLVPGDILVIFPQVIHSTYILPKPDFEHFISRVVKFSPLYLYPAEPSAFDIRYLLSTPEYRKNYLLIRPADNGYRLFYDLIARAMAEWTEKPLGYEMALRATLSLLFAETLRVSEDTFPPANAKKSLPNDAGAGQLMFRAIHFIEKHYRENIGMNEVANACNVSYYHFSHLFREYTGVNFSDYLAKYRIGKARKELLQNPAPIAVIAKNCGFDNVSYFIKKFRQFTDMTPKTFRDQYLIGVIPDQGFPEK